MMSNLRARCTAYCCNPALRAQTAKLTKICRPACRLPHKWLERKGTSNWTSHNWSPHARIASPAPRKTKMRKEQGQKTQTTTLTQQWDRSAHQPPKIDSHMSEKTLTLASLNVRGLGVNPPKQKVIKTLLASLPSPPQILLIQEHHLGKDDTLSAGKGIELWKGGSF